MHIEEFELVILSNMILGLTVKIILSDEFVQQQAFLAAMWRNQ